jgi:polyhydroxyalkanoate synthase
MDESILSSPQRPTAGHYWRTYSKAQNEMLDPLGLVAPLGEAWLAWFMHPAELMEVLAQSFNDAIAVQERTWQRFAGMPREPLVKPHPEDQRFVDPVWSKSPLWGSVMDWYLLVTHRVQDALYQTPGLSARESRRAAFWWRFWLNAVAPTNFLWTNPVALRKAAETNGDTLVQGLRIWLEDLRAGTVRMTAPHSFRIGGNLATTPGTVVFRNELVELIHYSPVTATVREMPLVIVTPWINKYYVLDLAPHKSLVQYLIRQGFSVFITSWRNPPEHMRDTRFDDYVTEGVDQAVRAARAVTGARKVHAVGYCIGGTLLAVYLSWLARRFAAEDNPVAHWTLFASLVDFRAPGDIEVFTEKSTLHWLSQRMEKRGYLEGDEMAASFRLLRPNSLIWHYVVHGYLYGEEPPPFDVLYWNMDSTRMPYRMHEYYLREMYLNNNLVHKDALTIAGEKIDLSLVSQPLYSVLAVDDHIAPWREAFRINRHVSGPKRCVLTSSGHILGIVNPPVKPPKRNYRVGEAHRRDHADEWLERAESHKGSWWEDWSAWLSRQCGDMVEAPSVTASAYPKLGQAPGTYVLEQ